MAFISWTAEGSLCKPIFYHYPVENESLFQNFQIHEIEQVLNCLQNNVLVHFSGQCIALATGRHSTAILGLVSEIQRILAKKYRLNFIVNEEMYSLWKKRVFLLSHEKECPSLVTLRQVQNTDGYMKLACGIKHKCVCMSLVLVDDVSVLVDDVQQLNV